MFRKFFCVLLALSIVMVCPFTSLAMVATPFNASRASTSNAFPLDDFVEMDEFDSIELDHSSLLSSGDDDSWIPVTVTNSVRYTGLSLNLKYYTMSGVVKYSTVPFNSNLYASLPLPSDCATVGSFILRIGQDSLPSPGRYSLRILFSSNTGVDYWRVSGWNEKKLTNASNQSGNFEFNNFLQQSGDWYAQTVIELGSVSFLDVSVIPKSNSTINLPYGGYVKVQFVKTSAAADTTTADGGYTSDNAAADTAQNTSKIVEQGDTIIETIKNVIQTISSQLTAFWNQLAGEFTNLYNKMNQQHSEQLEADRANTEDIISSGNSNTTTIVNNNNSNTDKITNGFDNTALNAENEKLNNSLNEYDTAEKQVMDKVNNALDDIDFNQSLDNYMQPILLCSTFLQRLYDNSGGFKDVINLTLIVSIASIVIGIYRFKGGD